MNITKLPLIGLISEIASRNGQTVTHEPTPSPSKGILLSNFELSGLDSGQFLTDKLGLLKTDGSMNPPKNSVRM